MIGVAFAWFAYFAVENWLLVEISENPRNLRRKMVVRCSLETFASLCALCG